MLVLLYVNTSYKQFAKFEENILSFLVFSICDLVIMEFYSYNLIMLSDFIAQQFLMFYPLGFHVIVFMFLLHTL